MRPWLLWCCLGCAGCTSAATTLEVELGTGADVFVALHEGDDVPIIHGLQGGYHVWGSLRAVGVAPLGLRLLFQLQPLDGSLAATMRSDTVDLIDGEHLGTAVFLPDPDALRGRRCHFDLTITDTGGRSASAGVDIVPR